MSRFQDLEDTPREGGRGSRRSIVVPPLVECEEVTISWRGKGPFHLAIYDFLYPDAEPLTDFGEVDGTSIDWRVDHHPGRELVFRLEDDSGEETESEAQVVLPGSNCGIGPGPAPSSSPALPEAFSSATTRYQAFSTSTAAVSSSSSTPSSSASVVDVLQSTSSTSVASTASSQSSSSSISSTISSSSTSPSTRASPTVPNSSAVKIITLTQTRAGTSSTSTSPLSSQDLVKSTDTASLTEKSGSKVGVAVGVTLGLGIPILLIYLAYFLHRRKSQQLEKPYAKFADLHSRPQSQHTTFETDRSSTSFYSLGTDVLLPQVRQVPVVPPIPAAFYGGRAQTQRERGSVGSAPSFGPGLPYEQREELSPFGDLHRWGGGGGSEQGESVYGGMDGRR